MSRSALSRIDQNAISINQHSIKEGKLGKPAVAPANNNHEIAKLKSELLRQEKIAEEQKSLIFELRKSLIEAVRIHEQDQEQIRSLTEAVAQIGPLQSHLAQISMMYSLVQMN